VAVATEDAIGGGPGERVAEQRVRNRIIEYLELAASLAAQADYDSAVPIAHVPYEVINQWEDQPDLMAGSTARTSRLAGVNSAMRR
jgi:hypothetical protein